MQYTQEIADQLAEEIQGRVWKYGVKYDMYKTPIQSLALEDTTDDKELRRLNE